jgi:hypothetical protein
VKSYQFEAFFNSSRLSDLLKRNKRAGIELEALAEAMSQLAKIGQELMRPGSLYFGFFGNR